MHSPLEKYKGERRERLPTQRGEACNSTRVLSRLVGSGAMCVFLCDFSRVLSKPAGSGATPEMKTYTLKIFNSWAKLPFPDSKHWGLRWNFVFVWLSWKRVNHVCPSGKWGNWSNLHNDSILRERLGLVLAMKWNREAGVIPVCCQVLYRLQPPSKIFPCTNFGSSLGKFHLMTTHTRVHSMNSCES